MKKRIRRSTKKAKRKSSLQKLKRKVKRDMGDKVRGVLYNPPGEIKMSDALEEVIAPFVEDVDTLEAMKNLVSLGALAWNFALQPAQEIKDELPKLVKGLTVEFEDSGMLIKVINQLIERKRKLFPDVDRYIVSYEVEDTGDGWHLSVASTLSPENEADA
ncbi:MAG: hypothetical protein GY805_04355 [Chloroflexi bacterium]|nr:hypothetical protein [Chloroflexota bacterium]